MWKKENPYSIAKGLPRMSWHPKNLFNLYQRTYGELARELKFTQPRLTLFQQKWLSRRVVRAYHGDWIQEKKFSKHYVPNSLPAILAESGKSVREHSSRSPAATATNEDKARQAVPLTSLMFREVERRLDVLVFRACLASSVYKARRMVIHGKVRVNGDVQRAAGYLVQPGDLFTVDPAAVELLRRPGQDIVDALESATESESDETDEVVEETDEEIAAQPDPSPSTSSLAPETEPREFHLPDYAAPFLFIPTYLEVDFETCSAVYVRHPTARSGYSEIPSPYSADGEVMALVWEHYNQVGRRRRARTPNSLGGRIEPLYL
ncbi:uncharacterized protein L969DRAFT_93294 [Mixia osmundae IAM 14324]|uniref:RNA-binding S4 domain-containing protein n=1 Tax=Mixia osmundae (strain CBS 9802 / IAM 14324 / JCM 22182 / KY 12970) TaxID=764103 RepID=G7E5H9_MIXOS|nr:uncharacterized protein L969DRAFT_93294 [Mixia osmundae IAM 14324]KEI40762.1 hypothetical protein L969DRAFT_93294 [Mixia osmundae IAM 14324]GAA98089.1 hypothetical protein E5Q_04771 [Mixia osmundae IAM 14324]